MHMINLQAIKHVYIRYNVYLSWQNSKTWQIFQDFLLIIKTNHKSLTLNNNKKEKKLIKNHYSNNFLLQLYIISVRYNCYIKLSIFYFI